MRSFLLSLVLIALSSGLSAQNLIPNPSFESIGSAPCSWITSTANFNSATNNWTMPTNGSTDIFSNYVQTSCYAHNFSTHASAVGQQAPHSGNVMSALNNYGSGCGFQPNYREYLQVQLTSPMVVGQEYDIELWVSLGDRCRYATNNIGVRFNTGSTFVATCYVLNQTPQFNHPTVVNNKTGWVRISGTVTATAAWSYMIIGNFFSNAATTAINVGGARDNTRYYIDDVTVQEAVVLSASDLVLYGNREKDGLIGLNWDAQEIENGASYDIQRSSDGQSWQTVGELQAENELNSYTWQDHFPPSGNLIYRVRTLDQNGQHIASNWLRFQSDASISYRMQIANHPVAHNQPVRLRIGQADDSPATLQVLDINGRILWSKDNLTVREIDGYTIGAQLFSPGMYIVRMVTEKGKISKKLTIL